MECSENEYHLPQMRFSYPGRNKSLPGMQNAGYTDYKMFQLQCRIFTDF